MLPHGVDAAVGRTAGAASVSTIGEAQYAISLSLPPGTRGLAPKIGLRYGHRNGSSLAGVGWSVSGLSAIYRCDSTWAQDSVAREVRNDAGDRFCLDGNKLRLVDGVYGSANSEYRTEIETFSRIRAYSAAGQGPKYFQLERKDGLIYEYGRSSNSRIESLGQSTVRAWALSKIRDGFGNEITFSYTEDRKNGSYRIDYISYTGNPAQGILPAYQIKFVYQGKPAVEIDAGYVAGSLVKETKRLLRVDVKFSGSVIRSYALEFEPAPSTTGRSRLAALRECAGSDCLAATVFRYQDGMPGLGAENSTAARISAESRVWPLDVNGDGREDLLYAGPDTWQLMLSNASGLYAVPADSGIRAAGHDGAIPIDYDADGRADLLVPYAGDTWWVMRGTSTGLDAPVNTGAPVTATGRGDNARALDINGDGYDDLVWVDLVGEAGGDAIRYRLREHTGGFSNVAQTLVGPLPAGQRIRNGTFANWAGKMPYRAPDFNGDGRADLVYRWTLDINEPDGPGSSVHRIAVVCQGGKTFGTFAPDAASEPYFGDFNGDGKSDLLYYDANATWRYAFSTGTGFTAAISAGSVAGYDPSWVILDWDGDGYDDLLAPNLASNTWHLKRSTGQALGAFVDTHLSAASASAAIITDVNGDGLSDLAYSRGGTLRYRLRVGPKPDLLTAVTDGYGNEQLFTYAPLTAAPYERHSDARYPAQDYAGPMSVVTAATASDGVGGHHTVKYAYFGGQKNLQGRGFQGFEALSDTDSRSGLVSLTDFKRDFPFSGRAYRGELHQASGTPIRKTEASWAFHKYGSGTATRFYPYVKTSKERIFSPGKAGWDGKPIAIIQTVRSVDLESATVLTETRTTTEPNEANGRHGGRTWTQKTVNSALFSDRSAGRWCLGRPTRTTQSNGHSEASAVVRTMQATWDGKTCQRKQVIIEPGDPDLQLQKDFSYDAFGNLDSESTRAAHGSPRTAQISFGADGRLPVRMTNALGESTAVGWDEALGLPVSQTDANGLATRWQYDAFGRWTLSTRSDGTSIRRILANCKSSSCRDDNHRLRVTTQRRDSTGKVYHDQWVDLDRFERPIALGSRLLSGQYSLIVRGYDPLGRISQQSVPCVDGTCDPGHQVVYSYDVLDRPLRITRPYDAANSVPVSVTYAYQGLTTVITDETGADSTRVSDAQGRPVQVIDSLGYAIDYAYDAFGSLSEATDSLGNVLHSNVYNRRGFRTIGFNVDRGSWSFAHNAFGELVAHTDANGHTTTYAYDQLGRPLSRTVPDGSGSITTRWNWGDEAGKHEIGRLVELRIAGSGISDYAETYSYDSFGRSSETRYQEGPDQYHVNQSYSTVTGLPETLTYPRSTDGYRLKLRFAYLHGHLARIEDFADSSTRFWVAERMDAHGVVTQRLLGDAITSRTGIDAVTGRVRTVQAGTSDGTALQKLGYTWDAAGNLLSRSDAIQGVSEEFSYDALHRLVSSSVGGASIQYSYDVFGNLSSKSDVGIYSYDPTRLHQVTQIAQPGAASRSYAYDANGSMTARDSGEILWYSSGLPKRIRARAGSASNSSEFQYTPDGRRWWHRYRYGGGIYTHVDIGGLMEKVTRGSSVDYRHTIYADGRPVAIYSRKSSGDNALRYLLQDHLGSIDVIASSSGAVDLRESFDPFGQRRGENWVAPPASKDISRMRDLTRRGYTGHEHLDSTALIHMNGRVYDPWIGRFLSADPLVDSVFDTQGWNRYSYVHNRPLGFIDPSGYAGKAGRERTIPRNPGIGDALGGSTPNNPGMQLCVMFVCGNPFVYSVSRHGVSSLDTPSPLAQPNLTVYTGHFGNAVNAGTVGNAGSDGGGSRSRATPPSGASAASAAVPTRFADFPSLVAESVVPGYYYAGLAQAHWQTGHYGWAAAYAAASIADAALVVGSFGTGSPIAGGARAGAAFVARSAVPEGHTLSTVRLTMPGEMFVRYESNNAAFSRVTIGGGVTPGTYAAPISDGLIPLRRRSSVYNLPNPEILRVRTNILQPPPGTPIIGPRPVSGGTGNEVFFPRGF